MSANLLSYILKVYHGLLKFQRHPIEKKHLKAHSPRPAFPEIQYKTLPIFLFPP